MKKTLLILSVLVFLFVSVVPVSAHEAFGGSPDMGVIIGWITSVNYDTGKVTIIVSAFYFTFYVSAYVTDNTEIFMYCDGKPPSVVKIGFDDLEAGQMVKIAIDGDDNAKSIRVYEPYITCK